MVILSDLLDICSRLNKNGVRYVLVGGLAIFLHGLERATRDIDFIVDPSHDNIRKIKEALKDLLPEACAELNEGDVEANTVVRMASENIIVDLMGKIGPVDFSNTKVAVEKVQGVEIPVADLETMLILKGGVREQDKRDYLFLKGKQDFLRKKK